MEENSYNDFTNSYNNASAALSTLSGDFVDATKNFLNDAYNKINGLTEEVKGLYSDVELYIGMYNNCANNATTEHNNEQTISKEHSDEKSDVDDANTKVDELRTKCDTRYYNIINYSSIADFPTSIEFNNEEIKMASQELDGITTSFILSTSSLLDDIDDVINNTSTIISNHAQYNGCYEISTDFSKATECVDLAKRITPNFDKIVCTDFKSSVSEYLTKLQEVEKAEKDSALGEFNRVMIEGKFENAPEKAIEYLNILVNTYKMTPLQARDMLFNDMQELVKEGSVAKEFVTKENILDVLITVTHDWKNENGKYYFAAEGTEYDFNGTPVNYQPLKVSCVGLNKLFNNGYICVEEYINNKALYIDEETKTITYDVLYGKLNIYSDPSKFGDSDFVIAGAWILPENANFYKSNDSNLELIKNIDLPIDYTSKVYECYSDSGSAPVESFQVVDRDNQPILTFKTNDDGNLVPEIGENGSAFMDAIYNDPKVQYKYFSEEFDWTTDNATVEDYKKIMESNNKDKAIMDFAYKVGYAPEGGANVIDATDYIDKNYSSNLIAAVNGNPSDSEMSWVNNEYINETGFIGINKYFYETDTYPSEVISNDFYMTISNTSNNSVGKVDCNGKNIPFEEFNKASVPAPTNPLSLDVSNVEEKNTDTTSSAGISLVNDSSN